MNWGYKLVIVFVGFATLIGTLVYKAVHTKYELVSKDYYNEELRYQDKIDGINNATEAGDIKVDKTEASIHLALPLVLQNAVDSADAWFYCKTDASSDKRIRISFNNTGTATINIINFRRNVYEIRLQFNSSNKNYYYTKSIDLR